MTGTDALSGTSGEAAIKTLLVSDLVNSTKLIESLGDKKAFAIFGRHDRIARDLLKAHDGLEIDKTDGFLLLFDRPIDAVAYADAYHRALHDLSREESTEIRSRVGIHLGEVYLRENAPDDVARGAKPLEVEGIAKPMAARLMSLAVGNQTLLTQAAFDLARRAAVDDDAVGSALKWVAHGAYRFKGVEHPVSVFEAGAEDLAPLSPPPSSEKVKKVEGDETVLGWRPAPGLAIPHRSNWQISKRLGAGGFGEVWLARHSKTGDRRVLKFCFDEQKLRGLQREVTLFRLLKDALGNRPDIARIIDWNFDSAPYFIESEYSEGGSLLDWSEQREGGIDSMPLQQRLDLMAQVAGALAAAHSVGILHKDLKPANILIEERPDGTVQARLADFGIGLVTDQDRLSSAGITVLGFDGTALADDELATSGTQLYMAPEQLEGKLPTVQADIYALGVMLYQIVVGDLKRALAPGWERDVDDEVLREDIAVLVDGSPERRLGDASEAARRLTSLEERRQRKAEEARALAEAEEARKALAKARKRRKLVAVAVVFLAVFAAAMAVQSWRIAREAERAEREAETARQITDFVISLFEHAKPDKARGREISARDLVDQGAERVDKELAEAPAVRARITQMLGNVYFFLGSYDRAENFFEETLAIHRERNDQPDASFATSLMNLAVAYLSQDRSEEAIALLEQARDIKERELGPHHRELADVLSNLSVAYRREGRHDEALGLLQKALAIYETEDGPGTSRVATILLNTANLYQDLGRYHDAETALLRSLEIFEAKEGPDHPYVARVLTNLASVYGVLHRNDEQQELLRRALDIQVKVLGAEHPLVARSRFKLGAAKLAAGSPHEAQKLLAEALRTVEETLGAEHGAVAEILVVMADVERRLGAYADAEAHCQRAHSIIVEHSGPESPDLKDVLRVLGLLRKDQGDLEAAAQDLDKALKMYEQAYGAEHPLTGVVCRDLALVERDRGREQVAQRLMERALRIDEQLLGTENPDVVALRKQADNSS